MGTTEEFRSELKAFLDKGSMTLNGLAVKARVDPSGLSRFICDENRTMTIETMDKLKEAME